MTTEAAKLFSVARNLPPGESIFKDYGSQNTVNSMRVALYRERNKLEDLTVAISVTGTRIWLKKEEGMFSYGHCDKYGNVTEEVVTVKSQYDQELETLLKEAKELGSSQELIDELKHALDMKYGKL